MNVRRRAIALGLLLGALLALAAPAWASAAEFTVSGTGDTGTKTACETKVGECTLRGALEAANAAADEDEITFDSNFDGGAGSTISLGSQLSVTQPVKIIGNGRPTETCATLQRANGTAVFIQAAHATVEGLAIEVSNSGSIGVQIISGQGARVVGNTVTVKGEGTSAAIESTGNAVGGEGNLIEGNKINVAFGFNFGIALQNGPNHIFGNEIEGSGCCFAGVWLEPNAEGNQIGGDTEAAENLITGYWGDAIHSTSGALHNEVGRNHGSNGGGFIAGSPTAAPTITGAFRSSASGTAEPEATVRVFRKATENAGEIESFLGEAEADSVSGVWEVSFAKVPLAAGKAARERQEKEAQDQREKEAKEKQGSSGGSGDGSNGGGPTSPAPAPGPAPAVTKVAPKVRIAAGPKRTTTATTARFRFTATPAAGAKFECKLDNAKWAACKAPKTYKGLKPGRHTFRARAVAAGLTGAVTKYRFTVKG